MISELARVFSSQGVLIQGTTYASQAQKQNLQPENPSAQIGNETGIIEPTSFSSHFEQASSKLELSKEAQKKLANVQVIADKIIPVNTENKIASDVKPYFVGGQTKNSRTSGNLLNVYA